MTSMVQMMQSPHAPVLAAQSAQAASQLQTGGQASGGTHQDATDPKEADVVSENRRLLEENQKLLAENSLLKVGNDFFMKWTQELTLKLKELKL